MKPTGPGAEQRREARNTDVRVRGVARDFVFLRATREPAGSGEWKEQSLVGARFGQDGDSQAEQQASRVVCVAYNSRHRTQHKRAAGPRRLRPVAVDPVSWAIPKFQGDKKGAENAHLAGSQPCTSKNGGHIAAR